MRAVELIVRLYFFNFKYINMCNCSNANFYSDSTGFHFCQDIFDSAGDLIVGGSEDPAVGGMLLRAMSAGDQVLNSTPAVLTGISTEFANEVNDLGTGGYEFMNDGKIILKLDAHLENNSPQERVWFWLEKKVGSNWSVVPESAKYFEFGYNTEGIKTYSVVFDVIAGDIMRLRGASETGTVKIGHRTHVFGSTTVTSSAVDLILYQLN